MMRRVKQVNQSDTWESADFSEDWQVAPEARDHGALRSLSRLHPLSWSLPLLTVGGYAIRLHVLFLAWGACEVILAMGATGVGVQSALAAVYGLLTVLVGKECIRAVVDGERMPRVRGSGGGGGWSGGKIAVLWPGGTVGEGASCEGRRAKECDTRHAVVGIAASFVVVGVSSAMLLASGATWDMLVFSPFHPAQAIADLGVAHGWMLWAWWLYAMSVVMCAVNLIPMRPMDAGVLIASITRGGKWWRHVPLMGWLLAALLICMAIVCDSTRLVALVACCAWWTTCGRREIEREEWDPVTVGPAVDDERAVAAINAWSRLREHGVGSISARELAMLDQWQAELRDRLHPEDQHPQNSWREVRERGSEDRR